MPQLTVYSKAYTATDDNPFQVDYDTRNMVSAINVHCYTNGANYGNVGLQAGVIPANAVVWFDGNIKVSDLWFKNQTPGSNTTIVITGILVAGPGSQ